MSDLIERFDFKYDCLGDCCCDMEPAKNGAYITYTDYITALSAPLPEDVEEAIAGLKHIGGLNASEAINVLERLAREGTKDE